MNAEMRAEMMARTRAKERLEEGLETLWVLVEEGRQTVEQFRTDCPVPDSASLVEELREAGLVAVDGGNLAFTDAGSARAEGVVRRHRLAEVLFLKVMELSEQETEETACLMEHVLSEEAAEKVCSFLGHPVRCPHGRAIPPGRCCALQDGEEKVHPLSEMQVGDLCEVVHIRPRHRNRLDRLGAYGLLPRSRIRLHQKKPAFVIQIDETDLALDSEIAQDIYVRRCEPAA
ncbi:MAG: metal-dependent transcriptional regulator [Candidatus Eisenbacteria bacterium]|nr:metal-dependent transcriptional regulator [Candidatus Eisenbacteria bacterium]